MATITIPQAIDLAQQQLQAGQLAEAEAILRQVLAQDAQQPEAFHLLGIIAHQVGRNDVAAEIVKQAIFLDPISAHYRNTQGLIRHARGELDEAVAEFRCALKIEPGLVQASNNLGNALRSLGRAQEAVLEYRAALRRHPDYPEARNNLGNALKELGEGEAAAAEYRKVIALQPENSAVHYNLALTSMDLAQWDAAEASLRTVLRLSPDFPVARLHLAKVLRWMSRLEEAAYEYRATIQVLANLAPALGANPQAAEVLHALSDAHNGLGNALQELGKIDESIQEYRTALAIEPGFAEAHNNLANALKEQVQMESALVAYRHSIALNPADASVHSNLVYSLRFAIDADAAMLQAEQARWNQQHAAPLAAEVVTPRNDCQPQRRLKVGYVSPDFWAQAECYFVVPLLEAHDRAKVEVYCYADRRRDDEVTERYRKSADQWRDTLGLTDAALAERIREDGIDILVDLTMHMQHHRLLAFARKPAPVQVSWLAYPGSTGLWTMDYRITDVCMEPVAGAESETEERAVRLAGCWCCYEPVGGAPEVAPLPALSAGYVTFGSLNNPRKMNPAVLQRWATTLQGIPDSRLLLLCPEGAARARVLEILESHGLPASRVDFVTSQSRQDYLRLYEKIDIALDPFPYNGITTTCDALWMGVPVLTVPGTLPQSRAGLSLLTAAGLAEELVSATEIEHHEIAKQLAGDLPRLAALRASLRARLAASPLMDAAHFAREIEAAYRKMWQAWCAH